MKEQYSKINSLKLGISAGIVGALMTFLTTLNGIYGYSKIATLLASSFWGSIGYSVSWTGALLGIIIGFIYAFILVWAGTIVYNKII